MADNEPKDHWTVDRRIPLAFILGLVLQTVTFVYIGTSWKTDIDHRIGSLEKDGVARSGVELRLDVLRSAQDTRITILEQKFDFIQQSLQRIERATVLPPPPR